MIGLKIGQLIRKPVRDFFGNLLDPSQPTNPDSVPSWQQQDPLPAAFDLTQTGQMGTEGATLQATMYWDKSEAEDDGCGAIETFGPNVKAKVTIDGTGGGLRWSRGPLTENSCGWKSWVLQVLTSMPASGSTDDPPYKTVASQSINQSNAGIPGVKVTLNWVPIGDPLPDLPRPAWDPVPEPEPLPEVDPETAPKRVVPSPLPLPLPKPAVVPDAEPLPSTAPSPLPAPAPLPVEPAVSPQVQPAKQPKETQTTTQAGAIVPVPPKKTAVTPKDVHVFGSNAAKVAGRTMRATATGIAQEVGRIEQKIAGMNKGFPSIGGLAELLFLLTSLNDLLNSQKDGTTYELNSVCECDPCDETCEEETTTIETEGGYYVDAILSRIDAIPQLIQAHKDYRQPVCDERPCLAGDFRTISFISDECSPYGNNRLRKRFRYRSQSGVGLDGLVDHWKDFTWSAGAVCVQHKGASWGTPQCWASSSDEGKRVILHAGGEAGIDPNKVGEWIVSGSNNPRYGVPGTMRVNTKGGFYWITERLDSDARPLVAST